MPASDLADRIRAALSAHGISQQVLAKRADVSQGVVSRILLGTTSGKNVAKQLLGAIDELESGGASAGDQFSLHRVLCDIQAVLGQAIYSGEIPHEAIPPVRKLLIRLVNKVIGEPTFLASNRKRTEYPPLTSYDCAISYHHHDRQTAQTIYTDLACRFVPSIGRTLRIWTDFYSAKPGSRIESLLPEVFSTIRVIIVVVGFDGSGSWPDNTDSCEIIPAFLGSGVQCDELAQFAPVILSHEHDAYGLNKLFWGVIDAIEDKNKGDLGEA